MKLKIKTWEQMEQEFGLDNYGDIMCLNMYTRLMEDTTPNDRVISVRVDDDGDYIWSPDVSNNNMYIPRMYYINDDMIEEYL